VIDFAAAPADADGSSLEDPPLLLPPLLLSKHVPFSSSRFSSPALSSGTTVAGRGGREGGDAETEPTTAASSSLSTGRDRDMALFFV
jgi:hypothetical protein